MTRRGLLTTLIALLTLPAALPTGVYVVQISNLPPHIRTTDARRAYALYRRLVSQTNHTVWLIRDDELIRHRVVPAPMWPWEDRRN